jgi:hypothetical protein
VLAGREGGFDVFGLREDGQRDYNGLDVAAEEEIVVGIARARVVGVEGNVDVQRFCGCERAGVYRLETE